MLKIEKDNDYYLMGTFDFSSLQVCLASLDECLNKKGIDKVMFDMYGPSGHHDMHSQTSYGIFFEPINAECIEVKDGDNVWQFLDNQKVKILRNGSEEIIQAKDLKPTDSIIDRV